MSSCILLIFLLLTCFFGCSGNHRLFLSGYSSNLVSGLQSLNIKWRDLRPNVSVFHRNYGSGNLFNLVLCHRFTPIDCNLLFICPGMPLSLSAWNGAVIRTPHRYALRKIKYCKRPCLYYDNATTTFQCILIGDLVFKLNAGPNANQAETHTKIQKHCHSKDVTRNNKLSRNSGNATVTGREGMHHWSNKLAQLLLCCLNVRSLKNKSAAFVDLVCDSKAD